MTHLFTVSKLVGGAKTKLRFEFESGLDPKFRMGEPYLTAAEALWTLARWEEAEDALERYVHANSSSIQGYVLLADVREKLDRKDDAKQTIAEALDTWKKLPAFRKKGQWMWWTRALFEKWLG